MWVVFNVGTCLACTQRVSFWSTAIFHPPQRQPVKITVVLMSTEFELDKNNERGYHLWLMWLCTRIVFPLWDCTLPFTGDSLAHQPVSVSLVLMEFVVVKLKIALQPPEKRNRRGMENHALMLQRCKDWLSLAYKPLATYADKVPCC